MTTVLVEIIRDSKNNFFFRDRELFKLLWSKFQDRELLGSRIIRYVRIRTYMCAQVQPRFVYNIPYTREHNDRSFYLKLVAAMGRYIYGVYLFMG